MTKKQKEITLQWLHLKYLGRVTYKEVEIPFMELIQLIENIQTKETND